MMEEDYAIIIGINHYTPQNDRGLKTLQGAVNDANRLEEWLVSGDGGRVPIGNIKKIISSPDPLKPLQDEIDNAFIAIEKAIEDKGGTARRLYFYFAGHGLGTLDNTANTALCLANWAEYRRQSALSSEEYKDTIKQYGYFEEIIFVADCCRNTKINIKPQSPTFSRPIPAEGAGKTRMFVAYATQYQDQSYEVETSASEMRGAFTTAFINGLKGGAANNGVIGADDLRDFLIKTTPELAHINGYKQIPDITHNYSNNEALVTIGEPIVMVSVNFSFGMHRNSLIELSNEDLTVIERFDPFHIKFISKPLSKGLYMLRDTVTDECISFPVPLTQSIVNVNF